MQKKEAILQSSLTLIVHKGLHAVTMADIAKEAQVGIGTIYKYFKDKEDIVQQLWIHQKKDESAFVFNSYSTTGTVKERFWYLWRRVIDYFLTHRDEYYFSYHYAASPVLTPEIHRIAMKDFLAFDTLFEEGLQEGLFKPDLSAHHLRLYTFSTINGWLLWSFDEKVEFNERKIETFITMAWDALKG